MPTTIAEVDKHFAAGSETITLTRAEWEAIQEISKGYFANGIEVGQAKGEMERVSASLAQCGGPARLKMAYSFSHWERP